jgi:vancomycin resistance protein YoaR
VASCFRRTDIAIPAIINRKLAATFINHRAREFGCPPRNASVVVEGAKVHVAPGRPGIAVRTEEAMAAIARWANGGCRGNLELPVARAGPAITAEQLREIDTVFASIAKTLAGSSRNRRHNIALAAAAVDGYALPPGAVFSYNRVVGPRTEDAGYRTAPVIRNGKLVPGTGGGACQLSSTLYQVALRAGLEIVARSHHSHPVAYTAAGLDATVVYPVIDLKFRNNLSHPVVLRVAVKGNRLRCQALGHGPAPQIAIVRQVQWVKAPAPPVVRDESLPPGQRIVEVKARRGMRVRVLRRCAPPDGRPAEVVAANYYAPQKGIIREGGAPVSSLPAAAGSSAPPSAPQAQPSLPGDSSGPGANHVPSGEGNGSGRDGGAGKNTARQG